MNFDVILSRIKFLYFFKVGITIITNTYRYRFLSERYYNYQIGAVNLGSHLQVVHIYYFFSNLVFIGGSSERDYFSITSNRNYSKCVILLFFLQIFIFGFIRVKIRLLSLNN